MTYMKAEKVVNSREFQQRFAKISKNLRPGQSVTVTNRGERIGTFTKARKPPKQIPDFYGNLLKLGGSKEAGQKMIDQIVNGLS
jgi:antitoxin (DNA-binding transcriptional repressor) of toxin-antitoxin stability system